MGGTVSTLMLTGNRSENFVTHYLVLSPDLLYVNVVVLGLLLCLHIRTFNVL